MPQELNFVWVGSPAGVVEGSVHAHDIIGPLNMVKGVDLASTRIIFWCLDEHLPHYRTKFKGLEIEVCSIDKYLVDLTANETHGVAANQIIALKNKLLDKSKNRAQIRDFVTIKEAFAFFLLSSRGGYVLDTNICISENSVGTKVTFSSYPTFTLPLLKYPDRESRDIWMMYSPLANSAHANLVLQKFIAQLNLIEKNQFSVSGYTEAYYRSVGNLGVASTHLEDFDKVSCASKHPNVGYWTALMSLAGVATVDNPRVKKTYGNTHKFLNSPFMPEQEKRISRYQLHLEVKKNNFEAVNLMVSEGADVNGYAYMQIVGQNQWGKYTPLHVAIRNNQIDMAIFLILYGADSSLVREIVDQEGRVIQSLTVKQLLDRCVSKEDISRIEAAEASKLFASRLAEIICVVSKLWSLFSESAQPVSLTLTEIICVFSKLWSLLSASPQRILLTLTAATICVVSKLWTLPNASTEAISSLPDKVPGLG